LRAVSIGKPPERMSDFWTVRFIKTEYEQNFGFPHLPSSLSCQAFIGRAVLRSSTSQIFMW